MKKCVISSNDMALEKVDLLKFTLTFILQYIFVLSCKVGADQAYCSNESVSCSQLENITNALKSDCMIEAPGGACSTWTFSGSPPVNYGSVKLMDAPPYCSSSNGVCYHASVLKLLLRDIKWTSLKFRFTEAQNKTRKFCRRFTVSSKYSIPELYYDCQWTHSNDRNKIFIFEYEAQMESHTEAGIYWFHLTSYANVDLFKRNDLSEWTPFLYVDVSKSPALTVRWQQAPQSFGNQTYELKVYDKKEIRLTKKFNSTNEEELSYLFHEHFPTYGEYTFEVRLLSNSCKNDQCPESTSPVIAVGDSAKKALAVGIVGSLVLICMLLVILWSWKRMKLPKDIKPPKLLIIYTQSNASHIKAVEEFAKYLRNCCNVDTLLDQLDIPKTDAKDPYEWYTDAFTHLDFAMVVSSPPKCCNQGGLYRDVDVIALRFLKKKFSDRNSRCRFFSVLLPYCTEKDIPKEAKHFQKFNLTKDLDKMLWFIHNSSAKFPGFLESACALLGPKPHGGESDLKVSGVDLEKAIKQAERDLLEICNCKNLKEEGIYKDTSIKTVIQPAPNVKQNNSEWMKHSRDVSETNPDVVMNCEDFMCISLNDLDLIGAGTSVLESSNKRGDTSQTVCDLDTLPL